jgi:hypothetical protein
MNQALQRGIASGEVRPDIDVDLASELLVSPVLTRMTRGETADLDPVATSERITALVFAGIAPR